MASAHQPQQQQAPSNPFDGFDAYAGVAAPPPASSSVSGVPLPTPGMVYPTPTQQPPTVPFQQPQPPQQVPALPNNGWNQPHPPHTNPFDAPNNLTQGALVPSATPSNPYALTPGGLMNQPPPQYLPQHLQTQQPFPQQKVQQSQQLVGQHQPFLQQPQQQQMVHVGAGNAWAIAPTFPSGSVNQMIPPPATPSAANQQLVTAPLSDDPFGIFEARAQLTQPPATPQHNLEKQMETLHFNDNTPGKDSVVPDLDDEEGLALIDVELDEEDATNGESHFEEQKHDEESSDRDSEKKAASSRRKDKNADIAPPPPMPPGRENAEFLSRNAGMMTSPLPRPSLVVHAGYVLSRISFRTVLLRKWKQTFWIQYGPTQLLFFRSYADFTDWLNNPYHTMKAREYLVKLRVDFVSDLRKRSVMGYQVTQIRRKPYGRNVMLHFKLERWMDYGPTIAAAFAARQEEMIQSDSYRNSRDKRADEDGGMNTTNDVSALRKIILGCMRNARDAALVASQERMSSPSQRPEYQGRYAEDENVRRGLNEVEGSPEKVRTASLSSKAGLYHQTFAAESSGRRKFQGDESEPNDTNNDVPHQDSEASAKDESITQIVDLLG